MHFKTATVTALVAATAANAIPTSNVRYEHQTIESLEKICISQRVHPTCIQNVEPKHFERKIERMVCFDKDSEEGQKQWNQARQGDRLNLKNHPTTVYQIQVPTMCGNQKVNTVETRRSNWLPIMRKDNQYEQAEKSQQQQQERDQKLKEMNKNQESKWFVETEKVHEQQPNQHQHVKSMHLQSGEQRFEIVDLHKLMKLTSEEYEQFKRELKNIGQKPEFSEWLIKYETQLPLLFTEIVNNWRQQVAAQYPESELRNQFKREFNLVSERSYLYLIQHVMAERDSVPRDEQDRPLQPSIRTMVKKVWMTLSHELTREENVRIENQVREFLNNWQESKPELYDAIYKMANRLSFEKRSDFDEMAENLLKIAQTGLRLVAQKPHSYNDSIEKHQQWDFDEERAEREQAEIQRWVQKANQGEGEQQDDEWNQNKKWMKKNQQPQSQEGEDEEQTRQQSNMFNKVKFAIRSLENAFRRH